MFIDLSDKKIVVVGGGNIATRRIRTLLQFTRNITAIAPKSTMELQELGKTGYVNLITRPVKRSDFDMAYMVIAATNDWKLNDEIHRVCKEEGIYVTGFYYPVVPKGQARIRVQLSAGHEREHLDKAIAAFIKVGKELGVIK